MLFLQKRMDYYLAISLVQKFSFDKITVLVEKNFMNDLAKHKK